MDATHHGLVVLAGGTGNLGGRVARALVQRGATVRAIVRPGTEADRRSRLTQGGVEVVEAGLEDAEALRAACAGAGCVASTLSGLREVIVDGQGRLLDAAVAAGVPRFVPSDFSLDYTALPEGWNRNFDLRREFRARVDRAPIKATSVFNGGFMDMLAGTMPLIIRPLRRVLYWENADRRFPLTMMDDTAAYTAAVALDPSAPHDLHVAGSEVSSRGLAEVMSEITGRRYRPLRAGSLDGLGRLIGIVRGVLPGRGQVFPAWQGMQYLRDMFSGLAPSAPRDNDRYPGMHWTPVREVLSR